MTTTVCDICSVCENEPCDCVVPSKALKDRIKELCSAPGFNAENFLQSLGNGFDPELIKLGEEVRKGEKENKVSTIEIKKKEVKIAPTKSRECAPEKPRESTTAKFLNSIDWTNLSSEPSITWDFVQRNINRPWNWCWLSANPAVKWQNVEQNLDRPWSWSGLSRNPNVTWENVKATIDKPWDFTYLSRLPGIPWADIKANLDKAWDWSALTLHPNVTQEIIDTHPNLPWNLREVEFPEEETPVPHGPTVRIPDCTYKLPETNYKMPNVVWKIPETNYVYTDKQTPVLNEDKHSPPEQIKPIPASEYVGAQKLPEVLKILDLSQLMHKYACNMPPKLMDMFDELTANGFGGWVNSTMSGKIRDMIATRKETYQYLVYATGVNTDMEKLEAEFNKYMSQIKEQCASICRKYLQ